MTTPLRHSSASFCGDCGWWRRLCMIRRSLRARAPRRLRRGCTRCGPHSKCAALRDGARAARRCSCCGWSAGAEREGRRCCCRTTRRRPSARCLARFAGDSRATACCGPSSRRKGESAVW